MKNTNTGKDNIGENNSGDENSGQDKDMHFFLVLGKNAGKGRLF